jgi:hypothetical protein
VVGITRQVADKAAHHGLAIFRWANERAESSSRAPETPIESVQELTSERNQRFVLSPKTAVPSVPSPGRICCGIW